MSFSLTKRKRVGDKKQQFGGEGGGRFGKESFNVFNVRAGRGIEDEATIAFINISVCPVLMGQNASMVVDQFQCGVIHWGKRSKVGDRSYLVYHLLPFLSNGL